MFTHLSITEDLHITDLDQLLEKEIKYKIPPSRAHNLLGMKYKQAVNYDTLNGDVIVMYTGCS